MRLSGVYTALVTPFEDGALDTASFDALLERQIAAGIHGLVPCGTTGEAPTLEDDEWADLVARTVRLSHGRVPVIAGCGSNSTARTVSNIAAARRLGADAALVVFPYYNKPNPAGLRAHIDAARKVGLPLVLYHIPGRTGLRCSVAQLAELCNLPGVVGVKEATGEVQYQQDLMELTDRAILSGDDFTFAAMMVMGGQGVISVLSNVAPRLTVAWASAAERGDVTTLRALRARLMPVVRALFAEVNPVPVKAMMSAMGLCRNELRLPLSPATPPSAALLAGLE